MGTGVKLLLVGLLAVPSLAGCAADGGPTGSVTASPSPRPTVVVTGDGHNATDVMFLQMMVPLHEQGIEIASLAERSTRPELRTLGAAIVATQRTEVEAMAGWLRGWGEPSVAPADSHAAHGGMPGTSAAEIYALRKAVGEEFERGLLNMLIAHQDDAIQVARMETVGGVNGRAWALAAQVDASRSAQIRQMLALLGQAG